MFGYLARLFAVVGFAATVIVLYYAGALHNESWTNVPLWYGLVALGAYAAYKAVDLPLVVRPVTIAGGLAVQILLFCIAYFHASPAPGTSAAQASISLFLTILFASVVPVALSILWWAVGRAIVRSVGLAEFLETDRALPVIVPLSLGFAAFATVLAFAGSLGLYDGMVVTVVALAMAGLSWRECLEACRKLVSPIARFEAHSSGKNWIEKLNFPRLSAEWCFFVLAIIVAANVTGIVRPLPIGWDDLGVYMNYPKLLAAGGTLLQGTGFIPWQLVTGIGYLIGSATQAFFLNEAGGFLAMITLGFVVSSLVSHRKSFLHLPSLAMVAFMAMPMVVFQQAKDMKLDAALMAVATSALYLGLVYVRDRVMPAVREGRFDPLSRLDLSIVGLIGVLAGFAFCIKLTSLMLVLGLLGVFAYATYGIVGFVAFFFLFMAVFTGADLWTMLNVAYPHNAGVIRVTAAVMGVIGLAALAIGVGTERRVSFPRVAGWLVVFLVGVLVPTLPWIAQNAKDVGRVPTLLEAINGKSARFQPDFSLLYSPAEIAERDKSVTTQAVDADGQTANEDFGRYFGYERGMNNYLKLPYNMTMQVNQSGEFTDITYLYFALVPAIFLFLPGATAALYSGVLASLAFFLCYYVIPRTSVILTGFFSTQTLPGGYVYVLVAALAFAGLMHYGIRRQEDDRRARDSEIDLIRALAVFATTYGFIYALSSYAIPWYGILLYPIALFFISVAAAFLGEYNPSGGAGQENSTRLYASAILLLIVSIYFVRSAVPHAFSNLVSSGYETYKARAVTESEGVFGSQPYYFSVLANLNIRDQKKVVDETLAKIPSEAIREFVKTRLAGSTKLADLEQLLRAIENSELTQVFPNITAADAVVIKQSVRQVKNGLYASVLRPTKEDRNDAPIYRIGTFLTYFISDNLRRYYEDSLLSNFGAYYADSDPDTVVGRMRTSGLRYLLVDLNAATIDKDPEAKLTQKFETLLASFRSDQLELVETDSICLRLALEDKKSLSRDEYVRLASVNSESYANGSGARATVSRGQKLLECYDRILALISSGKVSDEHYPYLVGIRDYLAKNPITDRKAMLELLQSNVGHGWLALFRIREAGEYSPLPQGSSAPTTGTGNAIPPAGSGTTASGS